MTLEQAIARQEGFGKPKTLATLNHNPGNIVAGKFSAAHGSKSSIHGYAVFPDDATGWAALRMLLLGPAYRSLTVEQAINKYCPAPDGTVLTQGNDPNGYIKNVTTWLGVAATTPIIDLLIKENYA